MQKSFRLIALAAIFMMVGCTATGKTSDALQKYKADYYSNPPTSTSELTQRVEAAWELMIDEPGPLNDQVYVFLTKELKQRQKAELKIEETSRHFAVNWGNTGRGGAALREPAYIHTLGGIKSNERLPRNRPRLQEVALVDLTEAYQIKPNQGYSHYELSRWERYCNYGKGMDNRDWDFIHKEGLENIPDHLRIRCNHPK